MKYKLLQNIKEAILEKCKNGKGLLELKDPITQQITGRLEFDGDGMSKTTEAQVNIISYIERILTFSRKGVIIFVDGICLDQLNKEIKLIEHKAIDAG